MKDAGRVIDLGLGVLDRQILDNDGWMAGKVDDLELVFPREGDGPPFVTAILCGPGALGGRIGGRLGSWLESVRARRRPEEQPGPARVPFSIVKRVGNHVELTISRETLDSDRPERWAREFIIGRIPGADRAAE